MKLFKNKKGFQVSDIASIAVAFVAVAVALGIGMDVLGNIREDQGADSCALRTDGNTTFNISSGLCQNGTGTQSTFVPDSYQYNATLSGTQANEELASWLPTIALIVAAAVIIGIIVVYLARRFA